MKKLLYILYLSVLICCQDKQQKVENTNGDTEWVDPNTIQQGPIIRDGLTPIQIEKIKYLYNTFKEVDPISQEKWIEDFKRDQNPDREIEIWMMMADTYNTYLQKSEFDIEVKKEVYKIILMRSAAPEDEVLKHLNLVHLSKKAAKEIMQTYKLKAKPIRVSKQ